MRRFGFISLLLTLFIAGVAGTIGYNWGYSAGLVHTAAADGATVVYAPGFGWGGGFSFFGLIFGIFFLFLIFGVIRRAAFGWDGGHGRHPMYGYGRGGWGRGPWHADGEGEHTGRGAAAGVPLFVDGMLKDWHRHAHEQPGTRPGGADPSTPPSGGPSPA